jgi:hypothetical protein
MKFEIELNEAEVKAMNCVCSDITEWIQKAASNRARIAMQEIFEREVQRMVSDPTITEIPADIEAVVLSADIKSVKEKLESETITTPKTTQVDE